LTFVSYLLLESTTAECEPGITRYPPGVQCVMCGRPYAVEYESSCTDPHDVLKILELAQSVATREHFSEHRDAKVPIKNTIPPQATAS
jgi:hypothetical protein